MKKMGTALSFNRKMLSMQYEQLMGTQREMSCEYVNLRLTLEARIWDHRNRALLQVPSLCPLSKLKSHQGQEEVLLVKGCMLWVLLAGQRRLQLLGSSHLEVAIIGV